MIAIDCFNDRQFSRSDQGKDRCFAVTEGKYAQRTGREIDPTASSQPGLSILLVQSIRP
jgi:hypothetical protein